MGVLNIFKKKKGKEVLDLPPPPPIKKPMFKPQPKMILPKSVPKPIFPKFKPAKFDVPKFKQELNIPKFKPAKFDIPKFKPDFSQPKPKIITKFIPKFKPTQKTQFKSFKIPETKSIVKPYIKADSFREITKHISDIKGKIKESEQVLIKLNELKNKEDKEFSKWHSKFEDVQRKLAYVDKTFFGGLK